MIEVVDWLSDNLDNSVYHGGHDDLDKLLQLLAFQVGLQLLLEQHEHIRGQLSLELVLPPLF